MANLPRWCDNPLGRELVALILADPPEQRVIRHRLPSTWGGYPDGTSTTYVGKPAGMLRRMHKEWLEREYGRLDRQFAITKVWDQAASNAIHREGEPNALITRLLGEAAEQPARAA